MLRDNSLVIAGELFLLFILVLVPLQHRTIFLLLIGWLSLWLRRSGWKNIGMNQPPRWGLTIFAGLTLGIIAPLFSIGLVVPILQQFTNTTLDLSGFSSLRGNSANLVSELVFSWIIAAFGEEMAYRGYILNRLTDLFGTSHLVWGVSVIISSILFGLSQLYQGMVGVIESSVFGIVLAGLYLASKRNLWLPILVHGINNTIGFLFIFLGLFP